MTANSNRSDCASSIQSVINSRPRHAQLPGNFRQSKSLGAQALHLVKPTQIGLSSPYHHTRQAILALP
jgi:hypothetical protein